MNETSEDTLEAPAAPRKKFAWWHPLIGSNPKVTLVRMVVVAVLAFVAFKFALLPIRVTGVSMEPTQHNGAINVINRLSYMFGEPQRGDVVAVKLTGQTVMYLKRIIAMPGETVRMERGVVYVNDRPLPEPYTTANPSWHFGANTLGDHEYLVIGDNRGMQQELHEFGAVTSDRIIGKALF